MSDNPYSSSQGGYGAQTTGLAPEARQPSRPAQPAGGDLGTLAGLGGAAPAGDLIKDTTTANFAADVVQESRNQPVLVDFWAPWCGPCKQLTPILERAVQAAGGRVKLVKMNIDEHPSIAGQLGIQSIPAVFAFAGGRPIDGFMGALPESEIRQFIERIIRQGGAATEAGDPIAEALSEAGRLLEGGDAANAAQLFNAILQHEPGHAAATGGLAQCYLAAGDEARAKALIDAVPADKASDPAIAAVRAKLNLAEEIARLGDPAALQARLSANPKDYQARFDLALIAQARGDREAAADHLLEIIRSDRSWQEDGARKKLLEFFDAWGAADPATKGARRKLSTVLFS